MFFVSIPHMKHEGNGRAVGYKLIYDVVSCCWMICKKPTKPFNNGNVYMHSVHSMTLLLYMLNMKLWLTSAIVSHMYYPHYAQGICQIQKKKGKGYA